MKPSRIKQPENKAATMKHSLMLGALAFALAAEGGTVGRTDLETLKTPVYQAAGTAFVRHNGDRFNNRPLYCNQISAIVLAGDRPLVRFGTGTVLHGTFMAALVRGDRAKWLHDFSDITAKYRADHMEWLLKDAGFGDTTLTLDAVPAAKGAGMALRLRLENIQAGDRLIWVCGGTVRQPKSMLDVWDVTTAGREKILAKGFAPDDCLEDRVKIAGDRFMVEINDGKPVIMTGQCSAASQMSVADASAWSDPLKLLASAGQQRPLACGVVELAKQQEICWAVRGGRPSPEPAAAVFAAGLQRAEDIGRRIVVDTPDAQLNALVGASSAVMDGVFRDGIFTHSGMRWGVPLLGWRTLFGGTAYGWHDRVLTQARTCLAKQITASDKISAKADAKTGLSCQSLDSRLFGKGRVALHHPWHYDMQSQFFDQLIHAWRWTGDAELEKILRPALELHLEYIRDCFDPDDDGLYESYANTWPTDDQWYNGGGTAEETAYAYTGHKAALELARRAGDSAAVKRHEARLAKIQRSFMEKLWIPSKQYVGAYVEQGGLGRLHEDCWLYAIFCPIDAGMLDTVKAAQALHYTEWGLEREQMPYGGERVWPSNWVPSIWSLREMWPGDNYHLALAYFQTGLADDGWSVLRGTFPHMAFYGPVPGDLGYPCGGTDFNDCASMFCRVVVEGLFGYRPDYPNQSVTIAPQFPGDWNRAAITTPDFSLNYRQGRYEVTLAKPATLQFRLPVRVANLKRVLVNGQPAQYRLEPAFGYGALLVTVPACAKAEVVLETSGDVVNTPVVAKTGEKPELAVAQLEGAVPRYQVTKVRPLPPLVSKPPQVPAGAKWATLDMAGSFNGDVRTIFQQQYLTPRPNTCSLRLATDGYSTWQMMLNPKHKPPEIKLDKPGEPVMTPQGVPFGKIGAEKNIAFTSLWDNWPRRVSVPVNKAGDAVWLLVCGFTPPMQGRIANAELRFRYADGAEEKLELVPPLNLWSLCPFGGVDYNYKRDGFALPQEPPPQVQLGQNCRAMVYGWKLRPGVALKDVTLETLSQEVVIGLMGVSIMGPR